MGGNGSGRTMTADTATDRLVEQLDDARWILVDAQDALEWVHSLLRQAEDGLQKVVALQQQAMAVQAAVERALGYTGLVERQAARVEGLTITRRIDSDGN